MNLQVIQQLTADLPAPFYEDQGALVVDARDAERLRECPEALLRALVVAAERELHVGRSTLSALATAADAVASLDASARGRLLEELLLSERPAEAVDLAVRTGAMRRLLPDLDRLREMPKGDGRYKNVYVHTLRVLAATPPDPITRLAALLHDIAKPDTLTVEGGAVRFPNHDLLGAERAERRLRGLKFPAGLVEAVETLVRLHLRANSYEPDWTDSAVRRLHLEAGEQWERLLDLSYADVTSARPDAVARARRRVQALAAHARELDKPVEASPLDGNELMERFGRGPGRWIGAVKQHLLELVREGVLDPENRDAAWAAAAAFLEATGESADRTPGQTH